MAIWGIFPRKWYPRGPHIDVLTPSLSTMESLQPQLNVQMVAHPLYRLAYPKGARQVPQAPQRRSSL